MFFREIMIWSDLFRAIPISAYSSHPAYFSHNNKTYRIELAIYVWRFTLFNILVYPEILPTKFSSFQGIGAYQTSTCNVSYSSLRIHNDSFQRILQFPSDLLRNEYVIN